MQNLPSDTVFESSNMLRVTFQASRLGFEEEVLENVSCESVRVRDRLDLNFFEFFNNLLHQESCAQHQLSGLFALAHLGFVVFDYFEICAQEQRHVVD